MSVALCLTGFIRDVNYIKNIAIFYQNNIKNNFQKLHIYYSCPSKLEEFCENEFNKEYILSLFNTSILDNKIEFFISFRDYDNKVFIDKSKELGFPLITKTNYHPYRVLSCLNGFSETAKIVNKNINYDFVFFSRLDIIQDIVSIDEILKNTQIIKTAYIWRTIPYRSENNTAFHVEDRFFICSYDCIEKIIDFYNNICNITINHDEISTEIILGKFFNTLPDIKKFHLNGLQVSNNFNLYNKQRINEKYSNQFMNKINNIIIK